MPIRTLLLTICYIATCAAIATASEKTESRGDCQPPLITNQPQSQSVCEDDVLMLDLIAEDALGYQWRKDGVDIPGAQSSQLTIQAIQARDAGVYTCVVSGECGDVISDSAAVQVLGNFIIPGDTEHFELCKGDPLVMSISDIDPPADYTYQWTNGNQDIPGATQSTYEVESVSMGGYLYRCRVSNGCVEKNSHEFAVYVEPTVRINTQPSDQLMCGGVAYLIGYHDGDANAYWLKDGGWINQPYPIHELQVRTEEAYAGEYQYFANGRCGSVASRIAVVTIGAYAEITEPLPEETLACVGSTIELNVGTVKPDQMDFQWYRDDLVLEGETQSVLTLSELVPQDSGTYRCVVQGSCMPSMAETSSVVTVSQTMDILSQPEGVDTCAGEAVELAFDVIDPDAVFQWYKDDALIQGADEGRLVLTPVDFDDVGVYTCTAVGFCGMATSEPALVTLDDAGPYGIQLGAGSTGFGVGLVRFVVDVDCPGPETRIEWIREDGVLVGTGLGLTLNPPPMATTRYEAVVTDPSLDQPVILNVMLLYSDNPEVWDPNQDGCNTLEDLLVVVATWAEGDDLYDADGNGSLDIRDLLYVNINSGTCPDP